VENPYRQITIRLGKTPRSGKTQTSDFSETKRKSKWTVPVTPGENPPYSVLIFLHEHASKNSAPKLNNIGRMVAVL
jgi:hypothetical protein